MSVWIGVDPGEKRIGIARGDAMSVLATPREVVSSREELVSWIKAADEEFEVQGVLIGMPRNMDGTFGPMAVRSYQLVLWLRQQVEFPVQLWDERLTSSQAQQMGGAAGIDEKAAAILLQSSLDAGTPQVADPEGLIEAAERSNSAGNPPI